MAIDRRVSVRVLYPIVPSDAADTYRALLEAVKDVRLSADGAYETVVGPYPGIVKDYFGALMSYDHPTTTFIFHTVADDKLFVHTFEIPAGVGLVRVGNTENRDSFLIVNRDELVDPVTPLVPLEVEPGCCHWAPLSRVTSMAFYQEYREADPMKRPVDVSDRLVHLVTGNTLKLADGNNCRLSYFEDTGTLLIEGGAGLGLGLPLSVPWDSVVTASALSYSHERWSRPYPALGTNNHSTSGVFTNGTNTPLIVEYMVRGASGMSLIVKIDGTTAYSSGPLGLSGWERYVAGIISAGTHTIEIIVTGGTSHWGIKVSVGRMPIKSINGLNAGGNVNFKAGKSLAMALDNHGISITLLK